MATIRLSKHHGLGNDFLVVFDHPVGGRRDLDTDLPSLARSVCDRRRGIGADGLLVATAAEGYAARMTLFNADGSRAEMSGNGIRCFAQALAARRGDLSPQRIATDAGDRLVELTPTADAHTIEASVDMGEVERLDEPPGWGALGCHPDRPVAHLGLGNPHGVVGVDDVDEVPLAELGAKVPEINLEIVAPTSVPSEVRMRVHERGVGVTQACGTGAVAVAVAASSWGLATPVDGKLTVLMDGGRAIVALDTPDPGRVTLTGPATHVADIEYHQ